MQFDRKMIDAVSELAAEEGVAVTTWIKNLIQERIDSESDLFEIATEEDLRNGFHNTLRRIGMSYAELAQCAANNNFPTEQARIAWMAIRDLETFLL